MTELASIILMNWKLIIVFFAIAVLYSTAGFGGGSSYLAVLALTGLAYTEIRATSLLCNIVVVTGGTYIFHKKGLVDWNKILPLILISMPMAFIGGWLRINEFAFFVMLGLSLLVAAGFIMISKKSIEVNHNTVSKTSLKRNLVFGSSIGLLSGIVGIGGGIFLAPLLHITNWDTAKKIAATASVFILLNSISGLIGQYLNPKFSIDYTLTFALLITVFIGGQLGSRLSANMLSQVWIKRITATLIAIVGVRILLDTLL